jgi:cytochrome b561
MVIGSLLPVRYHSIAITLHWVMAIAFLVMLASGLTMKYLPIEQALKFNLYQWHKSLGVLLLLTFGLRLLVRLTQPIPALPASMKQLEQLAAKFGHAALYVWMLALPLSGWVMVSASVYGLPTIVFGWFEWPHIAGIAMNEAIENMAKNAHMILAFSFIALTVGHIAAVIKHAVIDRKNLLQRMWWSKS